jgi:hypothetical protein
MIRIPEMIEITYDCLLADSSSSSFVSEPPFVVLFDDGLSLCFIDSPGEVENEVGEVGKLGSSVVLSLS